MDPFKSLFLGFMGKGKKEMNIIIIKMNKKLLNNFYCDSSNSNCVALLILVKMYELQLTVFLELLVICTLLLHHYELFLLRSLMDLIG